MTEKWFAKRQSVTARTDEDAAMASKTEGPFVDRYEARAALITLIEREIAGWKRMGMDASRDERALVRVVEDGEDDVTEGNVRWHIVDVSPPAAPVKARKLSPVMTLVLFAVSNNDENTIFATKTGTWAALVTRGLVTPGSRPTDHKLTDAGRAEVARLAPTCGACGGREYRESGACVGCTPGVDAITIPAVTVAQRIEHFIRADKIATEVGNKISNDGRLDLAEVWDFSPNVERAKLLRALAAELTAYANEMDAAAGFEALSRTPVECCTCGEPISLRFAEASSSDWKHVDTDQRGCGLHFGASAIARPQI